MLEFDINQYQKISTIGEGTYGTVYKVKEILSGKIYAAKILKKEINDKTPQDQIKNLVREVVNISKTNHPSIIKFVGFSLTDYEDNICPVIVSEYLPNSLNKLFKEESDGMRQDKFDSTGKLKILYGIASGMKYLHDNNIIHRDLKLENILLDEDMNPKVVDFGFSKCLHPTKVNISDSVNIYKGTPLYSAPEIWIHNSYTKACDVYAFGMIAYIIISNTIPFKDCTIDNLQKQIMNGIRPDMEKVLIPEAYKSLIERCWAQEPRNRPTFETIVEELENNQEFISDDIDENEFLEYVDFIKNYPVSFDVNQPIISIEDCKELIRQKKKEEAREHFILAKNFFFGIDIPVNKHKAREKCKIAADLGDIEAIFNYGLLLYKGDGVEINREEAEHYIDIAYQNNKKLEFQNFYSEDEETKKWLNNFKIQKYIDQEKELYSVILGFIEGDNDYNSLTNFLQNVNLPVNKDEFRSFFDLIISIANNHQRHPNFFNQINQIIIHYLEQIIILFSNYEIFDIFKSNKLILLFLFENNIIQIDKQICIELIDQKEKNGIRYCDFFFPEIKRFLETEEEILNCIDLSELGNKNKAIINFEEKRHAGKNESYLCFLIREDLVDEFKMYTSCEDISLTSKIKPSIFETNPFLNENDPTIIEYSTFYGSMKIFEYLLTKNVKIMPTIWKYAIHSLNLSLINFLDEHKILPEESKYYHEFLSESIKCHHNCISNYIKSKFITPNIEEINEEEKHLIDILRYHNYSYFNSEIAKEYYFFYLCQFGYYDFVKFLIENNKDEILAKMNTQIFI